jgi:hypothetical protein
LHIEKETEPKEHEDTMLVDLERSRTAHWVACLFACLFALLYMSSDTNQLHKMFSSFTSKPEATVDTLTSARVVTQNNVADKFVRMTCI